MPAWRSRKRNRDRRKRPLRRFRALLMGAAALFDFGGVFGPRMPWWYEAGRTDAEQDALALRSDWDAIGGDLRGAIDRFATEAKAETARES